MKRDIELKKIDIFNNYFQTKISNSYAFFIGFIIAFVIFLGTLYYQGVFTILPEANPNFWLTISAKMGNILIFTLVLALAIKYLRRRMLETVDKLNDRCLFIVEGLLEKVEKGKKLPSITILKNMVKDKEKGTKQEKKANTVTEKKKEENKNSYLIWAGIVTIVFSIAILVTGFCLKPFVNYYDITNGTSLYGTTYELQYETIPTVINGMTAVTSIIIGFSGAMLSLVYREHFKKDLKAKLRLLGLAFYSVIPLTLLAVVYHSLILGALDFSLKFALYALLLSLSFFIISMLAIFYKLSLDDKPKSKNKEIVQNKKESENTIV